MNKDQEANTCESREQQIRRYIGEFAEHTAESFRRRKLLAQFLKLDERDIIDNLCDSLAREMDDGAKAKVTSEWANRIMSGWCKVLEGAKLLRINKKRKSRYDQGWLDAVEFIQQEFDNVRGTVFDEMKKRQSNA